MEPNYSPRPKLAVVAAAVAVLFGGMTLFSGGSVLFIDGPARAAAGAYLPLVLWFNFLAGFAYIIAGVGLYLWRGWAVTLSLAIAGATLAVFAIFGWHILGGGEYETRTLGAMALRSAVWLAIGLYARYAWTGKARKGVAA
ncbi:hypothetical protein MNBD_ALPHA09-2354 [hydrothermal vent metagenome]|uniref:Uncharacterized protein n=1 Tax=hydrothermal vent metagenome TaxID=652676 RepID=A0A3B0UG50_9ZZZZ